jgi:hypothetical protein
MNITINPSSSQSGTLFGPCFGCVINVFWTVDVGFGIVGGSPTNEPAGYNFKLQDCEYLGGCDSLSTTAAGTQVNWVTAGTLNHHTVSSTAYNQPKLSYTLHNYDTVYSRTYSISWTAWWS